MWSWSFLCQVASDCLISRAVFSNQWTNTSNSALPPWPNNTAVNGHFNYVKLLITEFNVARVTFQQFLVNIILIRLQPIYPGLKNLTILGHRLTTFWKRDNMIILITEATITGVETFADNVSSCIHSPPVRISTWNLFCTVPANFLGLCVKESRSLLFVAASAIANQVMLNLEKLHISTLPAVCVFSLFLFFSLFRSYFQVMHSGVEWKWMIRT